ncbi:hypothetical protein DNTS_013356, partial [Danionella cerebrum]
IKPCTPGTRVQIGPGLSSVTKAHLISQLLTSPGKNNSNKARLRLILNQQMSPGLYFFLFSLQAWKPSGNTNCHGQFPGSVCPRGIQDVGPHQRTVMGLSSTDPAAAAAAEALFLQHISSTQKVEGIMLSGKLYWCLISFGALLTALALSDAGSESKLEKILMKAVERDAKTPAAVALTPSRAKEFLASLKRPKRNLWDRSRPDVQQWIQQFMYMGYDEARLETDLAYWMDQHRSGDQGRQHHYDENAPMGPRSAGQYRHGANVNYDYY